MANDSLSEQDIVELITHDPLMMRALDAAAELRLPDWVIGAGFVRNKVWDHLHGSENDCRENDIDLVYFDPDKLFDDRDLEKRLLGDYPQFRWEVVNQATAHLWNGAEQYSSTADALSKWTETATGIGITMSNGELSLIAPWGIDDLVKLIVRPTVIFLQTEESKNYIKQRVINKKWLERWPKLKLEI